MYLRILGIRKSYKYYAIPFYSFIIRYFLYVRYAISNDLFYLMCILLMITQYTHIELVYSNIQTYYLKFVYLYIDQVFDV